MDVCNAYIDYFTLPLNVGHPIRLRVVTSFLKIFVLLSLYIVLFLFLLWSLHYWKQILRTKDKHTVNMCCKCVFCSGVHLQTECCEQAEGLLNAQQQYQWGRRHGNPTGPTRRGHSTQPAAPLHTEEHICEQNHPHTQYSIVCYSLSMHFYKWVCVYECVNVSAVVKDTVVKVTVLLCRWLDGFLFFNVSK